MIQLGYISHIIRESPALYELRLRDLAASQICDVTTPTRAISLRGSPMACAEDNNYLSV